MYRRWFECWSKTFKVCKNISVFITLTGNLKKRKKFLRSFTPYVLKLYMKDLLILLVNKPSTLFVLYFVILRVNWFSKFIMLSIVYFFQRCQIWSTESFAQPSEWVWLESRAQTVQLDGRSHRKESRQQRYHIWRGEWLSCCKIYIFSLPFGKFQIYNMEGWFKIWRAFQSKQNFIQGRKSRQVRVLISIRFWN